MTTIVDKVQLQPLEKTILELQTPFFLINGKLERIDWSHDLRHVFRFIEIISDLAKKSIPENIFAETFIQFQYLSELLLESQSSDNGFNNDDMIAYFLALLDNTLAHYGRDLDQKLLSRILRFWGVDNISGIYGKKITQAKNILESAQLVYTDCEKIIDELLTKINLLINYLKQILPQASEELDVMLDRITDLTRKNIIPYANVSNSALTMIVAFFPFYLNYPAVKLYVMLHLREDLKVPLPALRKDVHRFRRKLLNAGIL